MEDGYTATACPDTAEACSRPDFCRIEKSVEIFRRYLVSEWTRKKTPYGLDAALARAAESGPEVTGRIFLNAGFATWLAYHMATTGESHYEGRHAQLQAIAAFNQYSTADRTLVAKRVAETVAHSTVTSAIEKMLQEPKRRSKFSPCSWRFLQADELGLLSPTSDTGSREPPWSTSLAQIISPSDNTLPATGEGLTANSDDLSNDGSLTTGQQVLSNASLRGTADIFPEYLSGGIRRDIVHVDGLMCLKAAVTMNFPYNPLGQVHCLMTLAILSNKVEYLAMALFNVHVESASRVRHVVLPGGVRLLPNPELTLHGCQTEAIKLVFGSEVNNAVQASPVRKQEMEEEVRKTGCVSMTIARSSDEGAFITLNLGLTEGSRIREKLYN
ncbi:hypothetical protein HIM_07464 [Hirsutella minnesotensis 3608]|uniref:Uncharacterized protein n=1 Tax=Hirsutella minnesotensis 3608 TaxID=1043627 RepID=A0A0F7ZN39_9HYPO|nr:hypothetical protein HIM_07464 [Hirsutella minnesotensis 3608]